MFMDRLLPIRTLFAATIAPRCRALKKAPDHNPVMTPKSMGSRLAAVHSKAVMSLRGVERPYLIGFLKPDYNR